MAFCNCPLLDTVIFPSLTTITGRYAFQTMFRGCSNLTKVFFPSLTTLTGFNAFYFAFNLCNNIEDIYFPALTTQSFGSETSIFGSMFYSVEATKMHNVHFPSNLQSKVSTLNGYPLFGGPSGYVQCLFDLPATS